MGGVVQQMLSHILPAILAGNRETLLEIRRMDDEVDVLYAQILEYMGQISKGNLSEEQTEEFLELMEALGDLENVGDTIETNLVDLGIDRINAGVSISAPTRKVLTDFHAVITSALNDAIRAVSKTDNAAALRVIGMKSDIDTLANSAAIHEATRLVAKEPNRIPAYTIEIDIIEKQKRIYYFAKRMAKTVAMDAEPVAPESAAETTA